MPVTDGQFFVVDAGDAVAAADLVEIQSGTSPFSVGGSTSAIQRPLIRQFIDRQVAAAPFTKHWAVNVTTELKGTNGAPDSSTYPEIFRLLKASGMEQTLVGGNTWEYTWLADPVSDGFEVDLRFEESVDGNYYTAVDCNFSFTMQGSADALATATFTGMGAYTAPADVVDLKDATANGGTPLLPITDYDIAGKTSGLVIRDWSVSSGITVTPRADLAGDNGYAFPAIVHRADAVQVTLNIEACDASTWDYFAAFAAGTAIDCSWTIGDGTRHIVFDLINVTLDGPTNTQGTPNMVSIVGSAGCAATGADSSLQITYS